jgi:hypothetical protein
MPNRRLTATELEHARQLLDTIRSRLQQLAGDDRDLMFALRRKVYKELTYDERDKPMVRRRLKAQKRRQQNGACAICSRQLQETYCVLDRHNAVDGYTAENTRLICRECDEATQQSRRYS